MVTIRRTAKAEKGRAKQPKSKKEAVLGALAKRPTVALPTTKSEVSSDIRDYSILIHGEKKIGKTSLLSNEATNLYLMFDPLQQALSIYQVHINSWPELMDCLKQLESGKHDFKTVTVDGVHLMYNLGFAWKCKQLGITHPNDENDFGKSWNQVKAEFSSAIYRLLNLPGIAPRFICHSTWRSTKTKRGSEEERLVPILPSQAEEVLVGEVDIWLAYCYDGKDRVMVLEGSEEIGAGHRVDHCFKTPDGRRVRDIWAGESHSDAYANLLAAFENTQPYTTMEEREETLKAKAEASSGTKVRTKLRIKTKTKA